MSWDVVLIRTKTNKEPLEEIESENIIPLALPNLHKKCRR